MKKYAIIKLQGHQYQVSEKDEILVDLLSSKPEVEVLMLVDEDKVKIGKPTLKNIEVKMKVLGEEKGDKVRVFKYKGKSRYRRARGFRAQYSKVLIEKISSK